MRTTRINAVYRDLLSEIYEHGTREVNRRTGVEITLLRGAYSFKLDLADGRLPVPGNRSYAPHVAAAETAWQIMGTRSAEWILEQAPKIWQDFVEDGYVKAAYGYRWRSHFGRDQLAMAVTQLCENPTNRQLYVSAWDPSTDGLGAPDQPKNLPCPVGFSLTRTGDEVHCSVFIRSSDVFVGLPYDVMGYALTLDAVAASCGLTPGTLHVTLAHPHYYESHYDFVRQCLAGDQPGRWEDALDAQLMPRWSIDRVWNNPDMYVERVREDARDARLHHPWNPKPKVVV